VGKYGVDVDGFEIFLEQLPFSTLQNGLVMIDEIGKMECLSDRFAQILQTRA
jgi:nucleoside-triphosphatase